MTDERGNDDRPSSAPAQAAVPLLSSAARVLAVVMKEPGATMREIARRCHRTERAVWQLLLDLERAGFVRRHKHGRQNRYVVNLSAVAEQLESEGALLLALGILARQPDGGSAQAAPAASLAAGNGHT